MLHGLQIRFNPNLEELIPKEQLEAELGGEHDYEFDHASYWEQLISYACPSHLPRNLLY